MTWTALVVLPSWCLSDCLSPLCQYCISMSVTVYIFPCRPPCPAIWRRELVLSVSLFSVYLTALCIPSLCLYPCSPSMLLPCIYQLCLPLPVVLTPLLLTLCRLVYAAHCPRGIYGFLCLFYSSLSVFVCVASLCLFYCVPGLYLLVPCVRISCRNLADNRLCGAGYEPVSMLATPGCSSLPMVGLF